MELIIYFVFCLLVSALFGVYAFLNAPIFDERGNKIEDSKLEKWKKRINKKIEK